MGLNVQLTLDPQWQKLAQQLTECYSGRYATTECERHMGTSQHGPVVQAIAHHDHYMTLGLQVLHVRQFVGRGTCTSEVLDARAGGHHPHGTYTITADQGGSAKGMFAVADYLADTIRKAKGGATTAKKKADKKAADEAASAKAAEEAAAAETAAEAPAEADAETKQD